MKMLKEFTKEQLMAMPLVALRGIDVESPQQEQLIQQVVTEKLAVLPPQRPVYRKDVPDIKTPEQELHWQEIIDKRTRLIKGISEPDIGKEEPVEDEPIPDEPVVGPEEPTLPDESTLAQPTEEGTPVTMNSGVTKVDKRSKAYRDSLKK